MRIASRTLALATFVLPISASLFGGWTDLPLRAGAKNVYVSSSTGSDLNDGLTPLSAKRTLSGTAAPTPTNAFNRIPGGFALITNGAGDQLLLQRGDTFSENTPLQWNK